MLQCNPIMAGLCLRFATESETAEELSEQRTGDDPGLFAHMPLSAAWGKAASAAQPSLSRSS